MAGGPAPQPRGGCGGSAAAPPTPCPCGPSHSDNSRSSSPHVPVPCPPGPWSPLSFPAGTVWRNFLPLKACADLPSGTYLCQALVSLRPGRWERNCPSLQPGTHRAVSHSRLTMFRALFLENTRTRQLSGQQASRTGHPPPPDPPARGLPF